MRQPSPPGRRFATRSGFKSLVASIGIAVLSVLGPVESQAATLPVTLYSQDSGWDWAFVDDSFFSRITLTKVETITGPRRTLGKLVSKSLKKKEKKVSVEKQWTTSKTQSTTLSSSLTAKLGSEASGAALGATLGTSITFSETRSASDRYLFEETQTACCSTSTLEVWDIFQKYSGTYEVVKDGWFGNVTYHPGTWSILNFTGMGSEETWVSNEPCLVPLPAPLALLAAAIGLLGCVRISKHQRLRKSPV